MKNLSKYILIALFVTNVFAVQAQAMWQWRVHLPYNDITQVEETPKLVYGVSSAGGLFSVNKDDNSIQTYSKISGLSENTVSLIRYYKEKDIMLVAYTNSNIDLLQGDRIYNISDIKNASITASKMINDVFFHENFAYLSCGLGIVALNLVKREIADTYILGQSGNYVPVFSTVITNNRIYALTELAIYSADSQNPILSNPDAWDEEKQPGGVAKNKKMLVYENNFFLLKSDSIVYRATSFDETNPWSFFCDTIVTIRNSGDYLMMLKTDTIIQCSRETLQDKSRSTRFQYYNRDVSCAYDGAVCWIGTPWGDLVRAVSGVPNAWFHPEGPAFLPCYEMTSLNNRVYVTTGSMWENQKAYTPGALMIHENGKWKNIITWWDIAQVGVDDADETHYFATTWFTTGLHEFRNDEFYRTYSYDNSPLETHASWNGVPTDGAVFDKNGHLWVNNGPPSTSVKVLLDARNQSLPYTQDRWKVIPLNLSAPRYDKITVGSNNFKWINIPMNADAGIYILNDANDPRTFTSNNTNTRYFKSFTDQDGESVAPTSFTCIVEDKDGAMWAGTNQGPIVFQSVSNVFNSDYRVTRIKIPRDDGTSYADYLLEADKINCIAVDGGNRKWFGTESSGVYLMSPDGKETIYHFTKDNSPLLSNTIFSIAINKTSGEVFFGTEMGIISYTNDASEPKTSYSNVSVYPNPVRPGFNGAITVLGLMDETIVRITDMGGNVVFETTSNGGTAVWDGRTSSGKLAASGVYPVLCVNKEGKKYASTRVVIVR